MRYIKVLQEKNLIEFRGAPKKRKIFSFELKSSTSIEYFRSYNFNIIKTLCIKICT